MGSVSKILAIEGRQLVQDKLTAACATAHHRQGSKSSMPVQVGLRFAHIPYLPRLRPSKPSEPSKPHQAEGAPVRSEVVLKLIKSAKTSTLKSPMDAVRPAQVDANQSKPVCQAKESEAQRVTLGANRTKSCWDHREVQHLISDLMRWLAQNPHQG